MKSMTPFLMFEGRAEEAIQFYQSVFKDVEVVFINYFESGETKGKVMQSLITINGNPVILNDANVSEASKFTPRMSFFIECDSMDELITIYDKIKSKGSILMPLEDYGFSRQFAWVTDPFGVSWQINLV
ncbi:VOC family protein [Nosocomiicoccus massiliensis]|uniref:VOC family protein n=1 Tax=Nosocomiicoccus massiliensis TaxID=1232430 RepID=A0AAF0YK72_9STAP|nr:VOC family protein [Nosocomiicoccus massiliensis]WOS96930.1 VOC family protein [Nosocomiicoccus massiliensis]